MPVPVYNCKKKKKGGRPMQITKFALGIRFAVMAEQPERDFARRVYEEIFSVLTLSELEGLQLYGGSDPLPVEAADGS